MAERHKGDNASEPERPQSEQTPVVDNGIWSFYVPYSAVASPHDSEAAGGRDAVDFLTAREAEQLEEERYVFTRMRQALGQGDLNAVRSLLEAGYDVDNRDDGDNTALHEAAWRGADDLARLLLDFHADVDAKNLDDFTPLMYAAQRGHLSTVKLLLDRGASVKANASIHTREGVQPSVTPLTLAVSNGHQDVVGLLRVSGAEY